MAELVGRVEALNIFPIKSCHAAMVDGTIPEVLDVARTGLAAHGVADREFVVVEKDPLREGQWHFVTQRGWDSNNKTAHKNDRRLSLVQPNIIEGAIELYTPGFGHLALDTSPDATPGGIDVDIFAKPLPGAVDQGDKVAEYFSTILDREVRLFRASQFAVRLLKQKYHRIGASNGMAGADGSPILYVSQASLDSSHDNNNRPRGTVPIAQYRGNVVGSGEEGRPYDEDFYREITIGSMKAVVFKACQRCPMPGIDQETAERGAGGQTILRGRLGYIDDPTDRQNVFGQNLNHVYQPGMQIRQGDPIEVTKRVEQRNFTLLAV